MTVSWQGHEFSVYQNGTDWNEVAGLYIFAGRVKGAQGTTVWRPFYIGQTQNFSTRLPTHEDWPEAQRLGATHVHAMTMKNSESRTEVERDLVQSYQPRLNVQLR